MIVAVSNRCRSGSNIAPITLCNTNYAFLIFYKIVDILYNNNCKEELSLQSILYGGYVKFGLWLTDYIRR
nr:MAG TPA: hypothetical protein [Caudoviricetes sp.]